MEIVIVEFIPTLSEYVGKNIKTTDPEIKMKVDDFCDFPGSDDFENETEDERESTRKRSLILGGFNKRVDDIIMLNRYALNQYNVNAEQVSSKFKEYDEEHGGMFSCIYERHDETEIQHARLGFKNFDWVCEILMARKIADEGLIIHLWATIEQYVKRAILIMGAGRKDMPYKWDKLRELSKDKGIDLELLPSYSTVNEIRVVNNKIKHLYLVDSELCKYPGFSACKGKKLSLVEYRTHEYALAAHHFMNRLVMAMGPVTSYAPDRNTD